MQVAPFRNLNEIKHPHDTSVIRADGPSRIEARAAMLDCPAADLNEACIAAHGKGALDHLEDLRLGRAVDLLAGTDREVERIAWETGYGSAARLSRAVMIATGRPPAALRPC